MLILKQPEKVQRDRKKHAKYSSRIGKVKKCLSEYEVVKRLENAWEMLSDRIDNAHKEFLKNADEEDLAESAQKNDVR